MSKILLQALKCEETPRRPLWIMRQAGRYLPEYRKLRAQNSFEELCADPDLAAEVTMMPLRRFALDGAIIFADLMSPAAALGVEVHFAPGPVLDKPVADAAAVKALRSPHPEEVAPEVIAALRLVKEQLDPGVALLGFGGAPLSLAAYLVQGGSKPGFPALRAMLAGDPDLFGELLAKLAKLVAGYLIEQHRAGADVVQIFDSWAGILSREEWTRHVRPHLKDLLDRVGEAGVPRILFANGAPHLALDYADLPAEGLALCWRVDLAEVRKHVGWTRGLQGNLDPAVLLAGPEITRTKGKELLARVPARGHILNLGHGIMPEVPIASVEALIDLVREEGGQQ